MLSFLRKPALPASSSSPSADAHPHNYADDGEDPAAPLQSTWQVRAAAGEPVAVVRVRNLQATIPFGRDAWGRRGKLQPVLLSSEVSFSSAFDASSAADRLVDSETVHYGNLSKMLLQSVEMATPPQKSDGDNSGSGNTTSATSAAKHTKTPPPSSSAIFELLWVRLTGRVLDGSRVALPPDQVPFLDASRLRSLTLTINLPKASLLGAGVSLTTTASFKDKDTLLRDDDEDDEGDGGEGDGGGGDNGDGEKKKKEGDPPKKGGEKQDPTRLSTTDEINDNSNDDKDKDKKKKKKKRKQKNPLAAYSRSLRIQGLHVPTLIGVNDNERRARQMLVADVEVDRFDVTSDDVHDQLERAVVEAMESSSFETLEALGTHIATKILDDFRLNNENHDHDDEGDNNNSNNDKGPKKEVKKSDDDDDDDDETDKNKNKKDDGGGGDEQPPTQPEPPQEQPQPPSTTPSMRDRGWQVRVCLEKPIAVPFAECPAVEVRMGNGL